MVIDLSSDEEDAQDSVVDLSSDEEDFSRQMTPFSNSHSDLADREKGAGEMVSSTSSPKRKRVESELKLASIPGVPAAVSKRKKLKKVSGIKIPGGPFKSIEPATEKEFCTRGLTCMGDGLKLTDFRLYTAFAGKRVILYGLPNFYPRAGTEYGSWNFGMRNTIWAMFQSSHYNPALSFAERADVLKANGVDQILFYTVYPTVLRASLIKELMPNLWSRYPHVRVVWDGNFAKRQHLSLYDRLQLGPDICEGWIPPRCRRFFFLVDNKKVIYSSIESSDGVFIIPSDEEIINAFNA
ncbi:hypothetical protein ACHQM5_017399 [Ranunculus cassubicifolius]